MWSLLFPLWDTMGTGRRAVGLLAPIVGGIATGVSGTGTTFFYLFNTWGAISAAISFGAEHRTRRDTVLRGLACGVLYALTLVIALHVTGNQRVEAGPLLPDSDLALFLLMAGVSVPLHLLGTRIRNALDPLPEPLPEPQPEPQPLSRRERVRQPVLG